MIRAVPRNRWLLSTIITAIIALLSLSDARGNELLAKDAPSGSRPACSQGSPCSLEFYDRHGSFYLSPDDRNNGRFNSVGQEVHLKLKARQTGYQTKVPQEFCGTERSNAAIHLATATSEDAAGMTYISLTNVKTMDLRWLSRNSSVEYTTEVFFGYRFLPFGEILLGKGVKLQRSRNALFEAEDDGWRMKFRILF